MIATAFLVPQPERMFEPDDYEDASILIASIEAQLSDPTYAARRAAGQAMIDLSLDAHRDAALAKLGYI
jgi:hypothetical protein